MIQMLDALPEPARVLTLRAAEACFTEGVGFKRICKEMGAREYIDIVRALVAEVRDDGKEPRWNELTDEQRARPVDPSTAGELVLLGTGDGQERRASSPPARGPAHTPAPGPARARRISIPTRAGRDADGYTPWLDYRWPTNLSVPQRVLCAHLLEGKSVRQAAKHAGVDLELADAWLDSQSFQQAMQGAIQQRRNRGLALLDTAVNDAIRVICEILNDPGVAPRDRIRAGAEILDRAGVVKEQRLEILGLNEVGEGGGGAAEQVVDIESGGAEAEAEVLEALDAVPLALLRQALERRQAGG